MTEFGEELRTRSGLVIPSGVEIDPSVYDVATLALEDIDKDYGENSKDPREHHNAWHGLDHVVRDMVIIAPVYDYIPEQYKEDIRELGITGGAIHDRYQQFKKLGVNEIFSAAYGVNLVSLYGSDRINNDRFKSRLAGGVIDGTTAFVKPDGSLVQPKLFEGEPDTHKFFMAASDVYAPIAIGGVREMLTASRNIVLEQFKDATPIQGYNFVAGEVSFLKYGLNPHWIREVLARFFPGSDKEVYSIYHDYFNRNIVDAAEFAQVVNKATDKAEAIGETLLSGDFEELGNIVGRRL